MDVTQLRVALFSGNYNYVRDGANRALNTLVGWLLGRGAAVRVYAPVVAHPAFPPTGDLVGVASVPIPTRAEYRVPTGLSAAARRDLEAFAPNLVHLSAPELLGHAALRWARAHDLPAVASVHTRFETYLRYYRLGALEPAANAILRRFYRRCDAIVAPSESMADLLRAQRMNDHIGIWSRGVDRGVFHPARRSYRWRRKHGLGDDEVALGFFGRLVLEKGLDVFAAVVRRLREAGVRHRVVAIGDGPARAWFAEQVPDAVFTGLMTGPALGEAVASLDLLLNPSVTETFGNVTSEAMACGVPVVGARATGTSSLVVDGVTGRLIEPGDTEGYAAAIARYVDHPDERLAAGAAGARAAERYSWDAVNGELLRVYLDVLARRGRG